MAFLPAVFAMRLPRSGRCQYYGHNHDFVLDGTTGYWVDHNGSMLCWEAIPQYNAGAQRMNYLLSDPHRGAPGPLPLVLPTEPAEAFKNLFLYAPRLHFLTRRPVVTHFYKPAMAGLAAAALGTKDERRRSALQAYQRYCENHHNDPTGAACRPAAQPPQVRNPVCAIAGGDQTPKWGMKGLMAYGQLPDTGLYHNALAHRIGGNPFGIAGGSQTLFGPADTKWVVKDLFRRRRLLPVMQDLLQLAKGDGYVPCAQA